MHRIPFYQLDAFTSDLFSGNPAAVCALDAWLPDALLQAIAAENNLSETAFFVGSGDPYELRWFTPVTEVDLCGHATLAAARVIFDRSAPELTTLSFVTQRAGMLAVSKQGEGWLELDLPARPARRCAEPPGLAEALGARAAETFRGSRDLLAVFNSSDDVRSLRPDFRSLGALDEFCVIASAPGPSAEVDFVSRCFAPSVGVNEDPVTGSAHCTLVPFWSARLGRRTLRARQVSARGGDLLCEDRGERVGVAGRTVLY
ncbi:MAG TPA: PhzF family phenazine biosynthesis protein, partial [Myxococcaceae bacterium]|nr:PhzF family phenazine biosynthesis protein [Myxococcaceae bacterium]